MRLSVGGEWVLRGFVGAVLPAIGIILTDWYDDANTLSNSACEGVSIYMLLLFPFFLFWKAPAENGGRLKNTAAGERIISYTALLYGMIILEWYVFGYGENYEEVASYLECWYGFFVWLFPSGCIIGFITHGLWNSPGYTGDIRLADLLKRVLFAAALWLALAWAWSPQRGVVSNIEIILEICKNIALYGGVFFFGIGACKYIRTTAAAPDGVLRFRFNGGEMEYFKICAANFVLSVITLGGYSPWAKIRAKNYLYGNTFLEGANFDYRPNPWAIFCARLIIIPAIIFWQDIYRFIIYGLNGAKKYLAEFGVFADSSALDNLYYTSEIIIFTLFLFAYLWLFLRGISFNARVSHYRNINFHFRRNRHFLFFLALLLSVIITGGWLNIAIDLVITGLKAKVGGYTGCGFLNHNLCIQQNLAQMTSEYFRPAYYAPFVFMCCGALMFSGFLLWMLHFWFRMRAGNFSWGGMSFRFAAPFGKTALIFTPVLLPVWVEYGGGLAALFMLSFERGAEADWLLALLQGKGEVWYGLTTHNVFYLILGLVASLFAYFLVAYLYLSSAGFKYFWNHVAFDGGRVRCGFSAVDYMWRIVVINTFAVLLSLGILAPWARIRRARYLAEYMWLDADAELLERQKPKEGEKTGAFGGEAADAAAFDIALV